MSSSSALSTLEPFMDEPVLQKMKVCTKCKTPKPATFEYFSRDKGKRDGFACECKDCARARYYNNGGREKKLAANHASPHQSAFRYARARVKGEGKRKWLLGEAGTPEAKAYIEYLQTITHCPDCAKKLVWYSEGKMNPDSASFDRIDSNGDYTKENVRIVCRECNVRKNDSPVDEWIGLLEVRVKKGIIPCVDEALIEYIKRSKKGVSLRVPLYPSETH